MAKLADKPFALIGVNSDEADKLKAIQQKHQITWRSFAAGPGGGAIAKAWNVSGWPTIYVLDENGVIRAKNLRDAAMEQKVEQLLAAMAAKAK
ncbi:MAG: redoxin domain-containing protein [Planctomycetes bacterium]|nr:redoxin domain-containing protein [Planctomycetota bacterium]